MKFLKKLFNDNNTINEKAVVGFIAFFMLITVLLINLITGYLGSPVIPNEFIFDGFMVIVLGAFGMASIDKWINKKNKQDDQENTNNGGGE